MFRKRISACYDGLTPGYRKLADFILNHPMDVVGMTATELARRVGVEPNTVTRFTREIGYEGYRELMQDIRRYVHEQTMSAYQTDAAQTDSQRLTTIQANSLQALQHLAATQTNAIGEALTALEAATLVWVVGDFVAYDIAQLFTQQLNSIRKPTRVIALTLTEMTAAEAQMQSGEALLAVVSKHSTLDAGYMVRIAREKGLTTLCLAPDAAWLPAREADITILTPLHPVVGPFSVVPYLLVLNWLWEALMAQNPDNTGRNLTSILSEVAHLREWRKESLAELGLDEA